MLQIPRDDADALEWKAFEQSGILTTAQATDVVGRDAMRAHLAARRWRRICHGILSMHNGNLEVVQQLWVAVLAAGPGALLAGPTALAASGVRGLGPGPLHVVIPASRKRSVRLPAMPRDMPPICLIRTRWLPAEHRQVARPPRTTAARAAVDAAVWAVTADAARTILAAVCQQGRATPAEIFDVLATRRGVPRLKMIGATLTDIAGGAEALSEINFLTLCRRFSLPAPDHQERRVDDAGRVRYLDAYWSRWRLHVEVDGAHHMDAEQWADDMLRQNDVWIKGDRILRFPATMIRTRPARVAAQLLTALEAAGWQP